MIKVFRCLQTFWTGFAVVLTIHHLIGMCHAYWWFFSQNIWLVILTEFKERCAVLYCKCWRSFLLLWHPRSSEVCMGDTGITFFLVYYVSMHVMCSFTLALGLFHCFVQFYICNQHISFSNLCIWMFGACSAFLFPPSQKKGLLVWEIILTSLKMVSNSVHGEPLLGVIRVCYNIALHRYFLLFFLNRFPISISSSSNEL